MNHYQVLGISRFADVDTIRSAFRALARRYHPDAGAGSSAQRFREVVEAYETLNDPVRRRRYDASLQPSRPRPVPMRQPVWSRSSRPVPEPLIPSGRHPRWTPPMVEIVERPAFGEDILDELFRSMDELLRG